MVVLLLALSACGQPDRTGGTMSAETGPPVVGDWVVVRYDSEPDTLNPMNSTTANATYTEYGTNSSQIFETLLQYDVAKNWQFDKPLLAESYPEVSADHLVYTFTIREGVRWHDGKPFSIDDVLFSAKAAVCPGVDDAPVRSTITDLIGADIVEGRKIRFTVKKPYFLNDFQLGQLPIIAKHIYDPQGVLDKFTFSDLLSPKNIANPALKQFAEAFNRHPSGRQPVGTGPYKFVKWDTGKEITLVRNDDYWGKKAYLDKIIYRPILDVTAALTALKSGEVDLMPRLGYIQYAQQTSGEAFEKQFSKAKYSYPNYGYIGWNFEKPIFKDKRVRHALTMLVNRQQIIDSLRFGLGRVAVTHFTPNSPDFNTNLKPLPYDPKRAAELLDEAGWSDHNGDGIRDKDGVPFRFELLAPATTQYYDQLLPILKEEFRKVGIDMMERRLEFTVLIENLKDHKFDAVSAAWTSDLLSDPFQVWHSSSMKNRGSNFNSFRNDEADSLIERARQEFDPEKRRQLYWRLQEIMHDEQPYTFVYYGEEAAAYHKRFQNVEWLPARPSYDLSAWFVPKMTQKYTASQ